MASSSKKRTLDSFFKPTTKKLRTDEAPTAGEAVVQPSPKDTSIEVELHQEFSEHTAYPFSIRNFPPSVSSAISSFPSSEYRVINDQPHLDLLHFQPYIPKYLEKDVFTFLRGELPFYRVEYDIKRFGKDTHIKTPRFTTVFGIDVTSHFTPQGSIVSSNPKTKFQQPPRPLPKCLDDLRRSTEAATGCTFNFCLVNYYANGADSISYHSDDERFLGDLPAIASFSLGARRDFLMKHKPPSNTEKRPDSNAGPTETEKPLKFTLGSGDMLLMRGKTQSNWLHSIPKRSGKNAEDGGRINITFRKAMIPAGTDNYYHYNVGSGPVFRWNPTAREMQLWKKEE